MEQKNNNKESSKSEAVFDPAVFKVGKKYEIKKLIGQGAYGQVVMCIDKTNE